MQELSQKQIPRYTRDASGGELHSGGLKMTLVLTNEEVARLLPMEAAIAALEPSYCDLSQGMAICPARRDLLVPLPGAVKTVDEFNSMPAVYPRQKIAVWRVNSDFLTWHSRAGTVRREKEPRAPGDRYVGLVFLFSMETGELVAIFPDGEMQRIRVGAANAIAAKFLARNDSRTLAMLGSGFQAGAQLLAMCAVRPIQQVRVFSPNAGHRKAFVDEWRGKVKASIEPVASGREACDGADIVVAATNAAEPVMDASWLQPGMFITSIRPYEFDRPTLDRCQVIIIHNRESAPESFLTGGDPTVVPELAGGGAKAKGGVIDWGEQKDIGELLLGQAPQRSNPSQITCFVNNIGLSLQFAACGAAVLERARQQEVGRELPGEWFTEDLHP
ncbi:MAG: ornithine cyclodeaminase family protein [Acidobacteria bacterium]|nr:ornithine cyclodeaminase family protein [Acidobacteriota bacterium]